MPLIGIIWITYSLKSHTSKRKGQGVFTENNKLTFIKKMQVSYKMQGLSMVSGDMNVTSLSNLFN